MGAAHCSWFLFFLRVARSLGRLNSASSFSQPWANDQIEKQLWMAHIDRAQCGKWAMQQPRQTRRRETTQAVNVSVWRALWLNPHLANRVRSSTDRSSSYGSSPNAVSTTSLLAIRSQSRGNLQANRSAVYCSHWWTRVANSRSRRQSEPLRQVWWQK